MFINGSNGKKTITEKQDNGTYLIDIDGDNIWDFYYDLETNLLSIYKKQEAPDYTIPLAIIAIIMVIILLILLILRKTGKNKKKK